MQSDAETWETLVYDQGRRVIPRPSELDCVSPKGVGYTRAVPVYQSEAEVQAIWQGEQCV